ncbi:MAG TPA: rod shape-determining protein RodA [Halanaerobiaceae bacterium]|jgi:rod shape determining protein RodA|nr:rod shape-determining protein RodA [Bacillota bacterium]HHU93108.1 rod shape-determining protein RodA [Halanaerobiaceae bacterium]HPZ63229.1 rod shape-determining protein RodA [Halanaerobiales bacterium]
MFLNRKLIKNVNWYIPIVTLLLIAIGILSICSAGELNKESATGIRLVKKQLISVVLGIILIAIIQFFDYRIFQYYSTIIYIATVAVLGMILIIGTTAKGRTGWISLGGFNFQPSELAKVTMILVLAEVIDSKREELKYLTGFIKPFLYVLVPTLLIILQNDLGTSLVMITIFIGMLFVGGANVRFMTLIFGGGFSLVVLLIASHLLFDTPLIFFKKYQLNRLIVFINPGIDPTGIGYNIIQSKIALGSGRLFGKGLFAGTQNQLRFLPEKHTDFIFSVIGEEFGFIGVLIVIILYFILLWQIINVAREAKDNYGRLLATGIAAMFFFHILENIGMTMGLMPITGLPLPFISYGGSSMITSLIAIGLVLNVNIRRKKIVF